MTAERLALWGVILTLVGTVGGLILAYRRDTKTEDTSEAGLHLKEVELELREAEVSDAHAQLLVDGFRSMAEALQRDLDREQKECTDKMASMKQECDQEMALLGRKLEAAEARERGLAERVEVLEGRGSG